MTSLLSARHFHDEAAAFAYVEARLWANGRDCPHCGVLDNSGPLNGKSTRIGTYKCYSCRKPFTVKVGTIFEASHVKLHVWLQAIHLLASSKKGFSANQFARTLGISLKAAWFLAHRLREAMRADALIPFGQTGGAVESDETFFGQNPNVPVSRMPIRSMNAILTLVDRESGAARSVVIDEVNSAEIGAILRENLAKEAHLMTDEGRHYKPLAKHFAAHGTVNHAADEYVSRDDPHVHTQTVENYYSVFKRGMRGTYQHCARRHLHRYCAEFDFRYSNRVALGVDDSERAARILAGVKGKRLTYRPLGGETCGSTVPA
jgi:transposase-like protein